MKKVKMLIAFIILLIIVIILTILITNNNKNKYINNTYDTKQEESQLKEEVINLKEVTNPHMYMTVRTCIEKYMNYILMDDSVSVYRIIDSGYINKFNITQDNVLENVVNIENILKLDIEKMYVVEKNSNEQEYYASGVINEINMNNEILKSTDYVITVKLDTENMIYSIIPDGYGGPLYEEK